MKKISFEDLCLTLSNMGITFKVMTHKPVFTMDDVVRELKIPQDAMAKTLLLTIDNKVVIRAVLPGASRLNLKKLASAIGVSRSSISFADKALVEELGFTTGAIPSFGGGLKTYMDKSLLNQDILYCGAGDNDKTFSLATNDLVSASAALIVDII